MHFFLQMIHTHIILFFACFLVLFNPRDLVVSPFVRIFVENGNIAVKQVAFTNRFLLTYIHSSDR